MPTTGDVCVGRIVAEYAYRIGRVDHRGRLAGDRAAYLHPALLDQLRCLFTGAGKTPPDQLGVEPGASGHQL